MAGNSVRSLSKKNPLVQDVRKQGRELGIRKVIVGLSGGADSCCLLSLLKEGGFEVEALHCNFHLRGEESFRDRIFSETLCRRLDIPLTVKDFDVEKYRNENKGASIEMACRELRYGWFLQFLKERGADRIAVGHNADDNIETFFLNMLRGSGTKGLKGMEPDTGKIWRPLLSTFRKDILKYLKERDIEFIIDSTNLCIDYRRNYLRNKIIPLIKKEWAGFDKAMQKTVENIREENKVIEKEIGEILETYPEGLPLRVITEFPAPELLVRRFIAPLEPFTTTSAEIIGAIGAQKPHSPIWELPGGTVTIRKHCLILKFSKSSDIKENRRDKF